MGFGKTHKLYKKYLYSLWVLVKPINTTKIFVYFMHKVYIHIYFVSFNAKIFVVCMGFTKTHKLY